MYVGSFCNDHMIQLARDPEDLPAYAATGSGLCMMANRISWFFDLRGPSTAVDSACSSSAMAVDIACQALRSGSCDMVRSSFEDNNFPCRIRCLCLSGRLTLDHVFPP